MSGERTRALTARRVAEELNQRPPAPPSHPRYMADAKSLIHNVRLSGRSPSAQQALDVAQLVAECDLWWVSPQMSALVDEVAEGVPDDTTIGASLLPSFDGLIGFGEPLDFGQSAEVVIQGELVDVPAQRYMSYIQWNLLPALVDRPEQVMLTVYSEISAENVGFRGWVPFDVGAPISAMFEKTVRTQDTLSEAVRLLKRLVATFALAYSPGVADVSEERPDRAQRRRAQRSGLAADDTRVIYLRNEGDPRGKAGPPGESNYHHRWMVSGHWRSQPYGPGRSLRRPVYIAPHVKGPEGAPMLTGEKVRALVR